jgi:predicted flap endonuclease-1-like 5' DNA nuclease
MVTAALNSFKDRIIRDDWVGQAKQFVKARQSS